ncbi:hypothetical protein C6361_07490 [Plantactinospora sp. BC1]|nr:hypothetical protein C6361_07490 [Plantactinospora sp. BC1]
MSHHRCHACCSTPGPTRARQVGRDRRSERNHIHQNGFPVSPAASWVAPIREADRRRRMPDRAQYHVIPEIDCWKVERDSAVVGRYGSKENAIVAGRRVARANPPSRLVVHRPFGQVEMEHTYQHDPLPPLGR